MGNHIPSQLQPYVQLVEFLGSVMGNQCEVVLHDVRNIENSIVAIKNSHISNRKVGGSLTDLALKILKNKSYVEKDFLVNYSGKTHEGKIVRSSTFFIKDDSRNVVGLLCFNMDQSKMVETRNLLDSLINGVFEVSSNGLDLNGRVPGNIENPIEDFHKSIEELTTSILFKTLSETNIPPDRMSADEKIDVVKQLNEKGVFLIKGAVSEVALYLKTSEATVYRYLNKLDTKQQNGRFSNEQPV
ncbi:helix-turn-helix transcriptional regulator [Neobacillus vireti]|uniref:YheO domain-containing protein n=1 Tax=Neobacillus vireti LMG 21834 TaxID=1131730 RepID=A0AB94IMM1_9BACI|nr:PAS domain-containing protein [Neobacillus vireti]ETI68346.1 YheO domain-containing protein [Neobacillus vireti LMG 21834]KLT16300.1 YheO-like PAS domain protein [Neobacillus vireti]